eukprot:symbB.v1.2.035867.t1/scaffold4931.1/size32735/4
MFGTLRPWRWCMPCTLREARSWVARLPGASKASIVPADLAADDAPVQALRRAPVQGRSLPKKAYVVPRRVCALMILMRGREVEDENRTEERATWRWTDVRGDKIYYRQWNYSSRVPTEAWMEGGMPKSVPRDDGLTTSEAERLRRFIGKDGEDGMKLEELRSLVAKEPDTKSGTLNLLKESEMGTLLLNATKSCKRGTCCVPNNSSLEHTSLSHSRNLLANVSHVSHVSPSSWRLSFGAMLQLSTKKMDNDDLARLQPGAKKSFLPASTPLPGVPEEVTCSHCGAAMLNDMHFCRKCGHPRASQAALVSASRQRSDFARKGVSFGAASAPTIPNAPPRLIARLQELELESLLALCERLEGRLVMPKKSKMVKASDEELDALCESLSDGKPLTPRQHHHQQQLQYLNHLREARHLWQFVDRHTEVVPRGATLEVAGRRIQQQKLLADGGFAYVYSGLDADSGERLAIRRVLLQDQEALAKAKVEIDLLSSLCDHPHIVHFQGAQIFSRGGGSSEAVYIFELCPGGTLLSHLETAMQSRARKDVPYCCPCLEEKDILEVLGATAQALVYLTRLGMIHYDVKSHLEWSLVPRSCPCTLFGSGRFT